MVKRIRKNKHYNSPKFDLRHEDCKKIQENSQEIKNDKNNEKSSESNMIENSFIPVKIDSTFKLVNKKLREVKLYRGKRITNYQHQMKELYSLYRQAYDSAQL